MPDMNPVKSEAIQAVGFDPSTSMIHVSFKSGGTHAFGPFTRADYDRFMAAPSVGKHFHSSIRHKAVK
jgi:hypothetical protein